GGTVTVSIKGKAGSYSIAPGDEPVAVAVVLGDSNDAFAGGCGEATYASGQCTFNGAGTTLLCKR
ncbi:MAG: hypothetical protein ACKOCT_01255, partial [Alphaproteobacteria bacterium]